jgi:hypothetical protein
MSTLFEPTLGSLFGIPPVESHLSALARVLLEANRKPRNWRPRVRQALTHHQATFTHADIAKYLHGRTDGSEQFQAAYLKVTNSPEIVKLGHDERSRLRFTTRERNVGMPRIVVCMFESDLSWQRG